MKSFLNEEVNLSALPAKGTGNRTETTMTISTKNLTCSGMTALVNAAYRGHINIIKILLTHGAHVNATPKDGITALMYASSFGNADLVKLLLQHKVDVNAKDNDGWTALTYAEKQGHADIVRLLKAAGAK